MESPDSPRAPQGATAVHPGGNGAAAAPARPIRMLVLKSNDLPTGGANRLVEMYVAHFDRSRVEPVLGHIVSPDRPPTLHAASPRCRDMEHHEIVWRGLRRLRSTAAELREMVARTRADVVTSNDMRTDLVCRLAGGSAGLGVPWSAFVHGWTGFKRTLGDMRYGFYELFDRWSVRAADEVWTGSHACAADVRRMLPSRVPTKVLVNAAEPEVMQTTPEEAAAVRAALQLPPGTLLVGTLGRMALAKGHALLAEAVVRSGCDNVVAVLLGFGEEEAKLRAMAEQPRFRGRIVIPGKQASLEQVPAWLAALDFFCFPSLQESLPVAVLEAMYLDNAIAAAATGDLPIVLENGRSGLLFPPGDVDAMADCIRRIASDAELRETLRRRAKERVTEGFLAPRFSRDVQEACVDLALRGGRGR